MNLKALLPAATAAVPAAPALAPILAAALPIKAGFMATCNPGGAGKWLDEFTDPLRGAVAARPRAGSS